MYRVLILINCEEKMPVLGIGLMVMVMMMMMMMMMMRRIVIKEITKRISRKLQGPQEIIQEFF